MRVHAFALSAVALAACQKSTAASSPAPAPVASPASAPAPMPSMPPRPKVSPLTIIKDVPNWATALGTMIDAELEDALDVVGKAEGFPQLMQSTFWQDRIKLEGERLCASASYLPNAPKPVPPDWAPAMDHLFAASRAMCALREPFLDLGRRGVEGVPEIKRRLQDLQAAAGSADDEVAKLRGAPPRAPR
jgi:hypothetical protein